jgi:hypothetical protein
MKNTGMLNPEYFVINTLVQLHNFSSSETKTFLKTLLIIYAHMTQVRKFKSTNIVVDLTVGRKNIDLGFNLFEHTLQKLKMFFLNILLK